MSLLKICTITVFFTLLTTHTFAEKDYMKFGKISQEEIGMTVCPIDSNASAVILGAIGLTDFQVTEEKIEIDFKRHIRIKVFNKDAFDKGNFRISLYKRPDGSREKTVGIKGAVYNMIDGKLEKSKLTSKHIFMDELDKNHNIVKIAMPDVKEGSIIELQYTIKSPFLFNLQNWYFQDDIPTLYSEYNVDLIEWYDYKNWMEGYHHVEKTEKTTNERFSFRVSSNNHSGLDGGRTPGYTHELDAFVKHMKYRAVDIPAFKNEPFITTPRDYLSSIQFELKSTKYPWSIMKNYTKDWANINETLLDHTGFGLTLKNNGHLKEIAEIIAAKSISEEEKASLAYKHISGKLVWNGSHRTRSAKSIKKAYVDKKGNSADINLNLLALCRKIGLDAYPVIISTRNNGMIRPGLVSLTQFNHVITAVNIDDNYLLMDATETNCPYNLLPAKCLNGKGRLVMPGMGNWVDLYSSTPKSETYMINLVMNDQLDLNGTCSYTAQNYAAVQFRKKYKKKESKEEFINELEEEFMDTKLTDCNIENIDSISKPIVLNTKINLSNRVNQVGDMVFLNPKVISRAVENAFKREIRLYPVDYNYPVKEQYIILITIPEGYVIDEVPEKMVIGLPNKSAKYVFVAEILGKTIKLSNQLMINRTIFAGNEYPSLRKFNEMIVTKEAEQVVLKKI
ncbi:DUF3857 domain-containing protein [bacterium]|nr:DUF3857 domain-containing protein [bacterium]